MAEYRYVAVTRDGKREESVVQAPSATAAARLLKEQGLLPTEIRERTETPFLERLKTISSVSLEEKMTFIENLGIMLKAGISVSRSLQILAKQTKNARFKAVLTDIHSQVEGGKQLAEALEKHPKIFSNIFSSMVRIGEMSGNLEKSLEYLGIQLQREANLRSKVKGAMIYPSVIISAMVIVGVLMAIFVLPKLTSIFKDFDTELPLMTRVVIAVADFMSGHAAVVLVGMALLVFGTVAFLRTPTGRKAFDIFLLHMFMISPIVKKINLARFSRILSSMLKSGIPIVQSLEVTGESMDNIPYRELVVKSASDVKVGKPLSESLGKDAVLFPVLIVQMLQVGEESGTVEVILDQLAGHYEEEVDTTLKNLSSIIEPLLLLVIGGVVGVLAVALISPIYNIGQNIK